MTDWWIDDVPYAGPTEYDIRHIILKYSSIYRDDMFGQCKFSFHNALSSPSDPIQHWKPHEEIWALDAEGSEPYYVGRVDGVQGKIIGRVRSTENNGAPIFQWDVQTILTTAEQESRWNLSPFLPQPSTSLSYVSPDTRPNTSTDQKVSVVSQPILGQPYTALWNLT